MIAGLHNHTPLLPYGIQAILVLYLINNNNPSAFTLFLLYSRNVYYKLITIIMLVKCHNYEFLGVVEIFQRAHVFALVTELKKHVEVLIVVPLKYSKMRVIFVCDVDCDE